MFCETGRPRSKPLPRVSLVMSKFFWKIFGITATPHRHPVPAFSIAWRALVLDPSERSSPAHALYTSWTRYCQCSSTKNLGMHSGNGLSMLLVRIIPLGNRTRLQQTMRLCDVAQTACNCFTRSHLIFAASVDIPFQVVEYRFYDGSEMSK